MGRNERSQENEVIERGRISEKMITLIGNVNIIRDAKGENETMR